MQDKRPVQRRYFIGGSDARVIMGNDEAALVRLWREKRGEVEPEDLSGNLIVQLGVVTEDLNRRWYEAKPGRSLPISRSTSAIRPSAGWPPTGWARSIQRGRFRVKFMLPWYFSEEAATAKYMPQLQHNMWVVAASGVRIPTKSPGYNGILAPGIPE